MKKIKSIIVLLFVLFSVQAIAQTTYKVEPYEYEGNTYTIVYKVTLPPTSLGIVNTISDIITLINSDAGSNSYNLIFNGNLDFSGQNLTGITPTLTTINGTLTVGDVNIGSITVNGALKANNLINSGTLRVYDNKILKVTGYANQGSESFSENSIIIGINRPYTKTLTLEGGMWNTIGFPNDNGITHLATDGLPYIWALSWNYNNNTWDDTYLTIYNYTPFYTKRGEGFFAFPEIPESATGNYSITLEATNADHDLTYPGPRRSSYEWFCLANPFTHSISIEKFLRKNAVQGGKVYLDNGDTYRLEDLGIIKPLQGFFVNIADNPTINFKLDELFYTSPVKSEVEEVVNYIDIDVLTDDYAVPVTFLHKETALAEYDIFDADKMFGSGAVAEPYFVLGERNLCIEAANTLPYTAPMNIKSGEARNVQIVVSHIPEQYEVTLVDGEEEIALEAGVAYETMIANGENSDRFQLIINKKNSVSIFDVENVSEISLRQYNRNIIIEGGKNIYTEIFNMLGQKVYETADRNFMLNKVDAGAYVVKVKDGNSVSTTKIVVK